MIDTIDRETLIRGLASSVSPAVMPAALVRAGRRWLEARPGGYVLSLKNAFELAQQVWAEPFLRHASDELA